MDAEQWRQLKEIVASALDHTAADRAEFLDRAGLGADRRRRVEAYLAAYESDPDFLEAVGELPAVLSVPSTLEPGDLIDGYRIVRKIGEGGMGEVFEAEQLTPIKRRLALKLLRPGQHGSQGLARFESERQTLASMSHRNIAQVFGAGTIAGRPYLAMELVEGLPITEYCDRHRLSIEERIELFIEVCRGVQHAHQHETIHRDLKPSNILVSEQDGEPFPKVIDFGISKATAGAGPRRTETGQWLGTPDYMSPEQATGGADSVDTRSDVYSLGVLLYELLTGCLPFDTEALRRQGLDVLLRTLREEPPVKPSQRCGREGLARRLAGDLDLVVLRALEKDADRRYASAHELARDLRRHLDHLPLLAAEPGTAYILRKLLRRHRWAFATAAMVVLSLLAGVIGTSIGLIRARAEAERANREAATATKVTELMWEVFRASDPASARTEPGITLRQVLDRGAERVREELDDEPQVQARLMSAIGKSYISLGFLPAGQALLEETVELLGQISGDTPELADNLHWLGVTHIKLAEFETSLSYLRRSLEIRRRTLGEKHFEVSWVLHEMGRALASQGETAESLETFEQSLALKREIYGEDHVEVAITLNSLGTRLLEAGDLERGMPMIERSLVILERDLGPDHSMLAVSLNNLAKAHWDLDHHETAEQLQLRALAIDEKAFGAGHPNVAISLRNLALQAWESRGDCDRALEWVSRAKAIFEQHYPPDHPRVEAISEEWVSYHKQCGGLR